jgi:5-formyltetrahydrofolate cyclo-ligase
MVLGERRADSLAVGVTIAKRVIDLVPMLSHDEPVDWIATENGVIECSTRM